MTLRRLLKQVLLWSAAAAIFLGTASAQISDSLVPDGWVVYQTPTDESDAMRCANYSRREWQVTLSDFAKVLIAPAPRTTGKPLQAQLPSGVKLQPGMIGSMVTQRLQNGWLLGFDGGEFGGGLWFATFDGKAQQLSNENVHGFVETSESILIFVGLNHMMLDSGKVLTIPLAFKSKADLKTLIELDGAPDAFTKVSADTVLVVTTHGISRINSDGTSKRLLRRDFGVLYPNSVVSTNDGTIYAGMRLFVVRFAQHSGEYKDEWLVQKTCTKFHIQDFDCICTK